MLYSHIHTNISRSIIKHNLRTSTNERTNTLLYKNISLTLYSRKGWCFLCVRGEWRQGRTIILTQAALLCHLGWVAQTWVTEGPNSSVYRWHWRGAPHSPKPQHYWNLTIRLFSFCSMTLIGGGGLPLCRGAVSVFYSPSRLGKH